MALNKTVFRTRALSALIFCMIMLTGLLTNFWTFFILFSIIHFGCWSEYQKIISRIDTNYTQITGAHKYGVRLAGWCMMLYFVNGDVLIGGISLHQIGYYGGLIFVLVLPLLEIIFVRNISFKNIGYSFLGLVYISLSWALFIYLRSNISGFEFVNKIMALAIIVSIWINDTMAYLVGSFIGKTPLTRISPKKTWEGTIGGVVLSILVMAVAGYFVTTRLFNSEFFWESVIQWGAMAAIASVTGTFGDLLESKLKRMADIKDSGQILPGHGGFLDRFDSLLVAIPFLWIYLVLLAK